MLEFLSVCSHPGHALPVWQYLQGMPPLVARLEKEAPVYAALLQPIVTMAMARCATVNGRDHPPEAIA